MTTRQFLTLGFAVAAMVAIAGPARAVPGGDMSVVGSWYGTITATNPPLGQFNDLISFHTGGIVIESRRYFVPGTPFGNLLETTGHGAWERTGANSFAASFRFLVQDADAGTVIGTDNVSLSLTLDQGTGILTGTFESQIRDTAGNLLLTVTGTYSATPIAL